MNKSVISWLLWVLALVAVAVVIGPKLLKVVPEQGVAAHGEAAIGGAFTLVNQDGKTVTQADFEGKFMLVYFGFTHCPDICPTTLLMLTQALKQIGRDADMVVPVFITLDPARDTPDVLKAYVQNFSTNMVGLTGSKDQIDAVADAYKVYFSKVKSQDSAMDYMIDHSGFVYLMDRKGRYLAHFNHTMALELLVSGIRKHVY